MELPDVYVICLRSVFEQRGAKTIAYLQSELEAAQTVIRFDAVEPGDFNLEDVAATTQTAIIRGRAERLTIADMSKPQQVACFLSHRALWQVCSDINRPIVIVEDDSRPVHVAGRVRAALSHATLLLQQTLTDKLVVLLQCTPRRARFQTSARTCVAVHGFIGTGMYYLTPEAARLLLTYSVLAPLHVDAYMSLCIKAYDLPVWAVPGAADQGSGNSTLGHTSLWTIQTERQKQIIKILAVVAAVLAAWSVLSVVLICLYRRK
jgi:GR25 family glycosyltransferase involved in LPS biosynthesis